MIKNKDIDWYKKVKLFKYFAVIFLPLLIILLSTLIAVNNLQTQKNKQILMEREKTIGIINKLNIQNTFTTVTSDLKVIKNSAALNDYVNNPTTKNLNELNKMFLRFSKTKTIYDQLRFINVKGMEIARVNYNDGNVYIASEKQLQNKRDRDYFKGMLNLKPEEIYISQFDLNVENGKIEEPIKPTIRFGVPIFKSNGEKLGILVFNYLGQNVLDIINENMKQNGKFSIELLNSEGYFLKSMDENNNWSFMYSNKKNTSFKSVDKDMWDTISQNESGHLENKKNIYYYDTVYPLSYIREKKDNNFSQDIGYTYWKSIISYTSEEFSFMKSLRANGFLELAVYSS